MLSFFKKIFSSKLFLGLISVVLIVVALKKVDIELIARDIESVPLWFVLINIFYQFVVLIIIAYRWTILVFKKPKIVDVWNFVRAIYIGMFYSLFFPSSGAAIDLIKWVPISKRYSNLSKETILGTLVLDRLLTLSAFYTMALFGLIVANLIGFSYPAYLFYFILLIFILFILFFTLLFTNKINFLFKKSIYLSNLKNTEHILRNKKRLIKNLSIGLLTEVLWILPIWFISNYFNAGFSLISIYVFAPLIATILVLPISLSGFGARENLYLYFFGQMNNMVDEKILLVSSFFGIIGVISCLLGGIFMLMPSERKLK